MCGVQDLKPSVFALSLPANNLIRFSDDFGGETNLYQGFDVNLEGAFPERRVPQGRYWRDVAHLRQLQPPRRRPRRRAVAHRARRCRAPKSTPMARRRAIVNIRTGRMRSSQAPTRCPFDIQLAGTYQFSRGVQTGGAGPSIQANWAIASAVANGGSARAPGPARRRAPSS